MKLFKLIAVIAHCCYVLVMIIMAPIAIYSEAATVKEALIIAGVMYVILWIIVVGVYAMVKISDKIDPDE